MPFYNPQAETLSRDELTALQDARLKDVVRHVCERSGFFRRKLAAAGVDPRGFRGLEDLHQLPFMGKDDFRAEYPLGMSCVDKRAIAEMHMSSGSTGTPVVMPYTEADLAFIVPRVLELTYTAHDLQAWGQDLAAYDPRPAAEHGQNNGD